MTDRPSTVLPRPGGKATPVGPAAPDPRPRFHGRAQDSGRAPRGPLAGLALFVGCAVAAALVSLGPGADLDPPARRALFILTFAAALWVTEAIAAYAVGLLVIALQILMLGRPRASDGDWAVYPEVLGNPLIWLFFGGFVLAAGMSRTRLDRRLAERMLARAGDRPPAVLLAVMAITFVLSMFMSNTATAAMMLGLVGPMLASMRADDPGGTGLCLGVAVAANLGGMGSLIGTPPNAIAVGALETVREGLSVSFMDWVVVGLPVALVLAVAAWRGILWLYPTQAESIRLPAAPAHREGAGEGADDGVPRWQRVVMGGTLAATAGLWLTSSWHGLPVVVVSFLATVVLTSTAILGVAEIRALPYDVMFMLAGGLALGGMVLDTGLADVLVAALPLEGVGIPAVALGLAFVSVVVSNLMSNTAAANILVPLGITVAAGSEAEVAVPIALAASAAMALPIATPPNALASASGRVVARDFVRMGVAIGLVAPPLAVAWTSFVIPLLRGS